MNNHLFQVKNEGEIFLEKSSYVPSKTEIGIIELELGLA